MSLSNKLAFLNCLHISDFLSFFFFNLLMFLLLLCSQRFWGYHRHGER